VSLIAWDNALDADAWLREDLAFNISATLPATIGELKEVPEALA
jgi:hypothetical protein